MAGMLRIVSFAVIGMCISATEGLAADSRGDARPNIIFFLGDDHPQVCLGALGNRHIQTPHLDQLAAEGVLFTNAFVTTSICCSNRANILTGQYMRRHGIRDFAQPLSAAAFAQTYPALLRQAGYRTGYLGKYAIGATQPEIRALSLPAEHFDTWLGFPQSINFLQKEDGQPRYLTTVMEEQAIEFLRSQPRQAPFCLVVALKEPHGPWNYFDPESPDTYEGVTIPPPATFTAADFAALPECIRESLNGQGSEQLLANAEAYQERTRTFYRLITRADLAVGRILAALKECGLDENTVVVYSSDNGEMQGAHGLTGKWLMYEESIRIPMIIRDPRMPASMRGSRCEEMVLNLDLAPTLLSLAGVSVPETMQGRDLTELLRGEASEWRDDFYYEHTYNTKPPRRPIVKCEGVRTRKWKYTRYSEMTPLLEQLFDLESDPQERHDLAGDPSQADILEQLRKRCDQFRRVLE